MVGFTDVGFKPKNVNLNRCKFEYQIFSHVLDVLHVDRFIFYKEI